MLADALNSVCVDCSATPLNTPCPPGYVNIVTLQTCEKCSEWTCVDPIFVSIDESPRLLNQPLIVSGSDEQPIYYDPTSAVNTSKFTARNIVIGTIIGATFFLLLVGALVYRIYWIKYGRSRRQPYGYYGKGYQDQMQELTPANAGTRIKGSTRIQSAVFSLVSKTSKNARRQQPFYNEKTLKNSYWKQRSSSPESVRTTPNLPQGIVTKDSQKNSNESKKGSQENVDFSAGMAARATSHPSPYLIENDDEYQRVLMLNKFERFNALPGPIHNEHNQFSTSVKEENQASGSVGMVANSSPSTIFQRVSFKLSSNLSHVKSALSLHCFGKSQPKSILPVSIGDVNHVKHTIVRGNNKPEPRISATQAFNLDPAFTGLLTLKTPNLKFSEVRLSDTIDEVFNETSCGPVGKELKISSQVRHSIGNEETGGYNIQHSNEADDYVHSPFSSRISSQTISDKGNKGRSASIPLILPEGTVQYLQQYPPLKHSLNSENNEQHITTTDYLGDDYDRNPCSYLSTPAGSVDPRSTNVGSGSVDLCLYTGAPKFGSNPTDFSNHRSDMTSDQQSAPEKESSELEKCLTKKITDIPSGSKHSVMQKAHMFKNKRGENIQRVNERRRLSPQASHFPIASGKECSDKVRLATLRTYKPEVLRETFLAQDGIAGSHSTHSSTSNQPETSKSVRSSQFGEYSDHHGHVVQPSYDSHLSHLQYAVPRRVSATSYRNANRGSQDGNIHTQTRGSTLFSSWHGDPNSFLYPLTTSQAAFFKTEASDEESTAYYRPYHHTHKNTHSNHYESDIQCEPGIFSSSNSASPNGSDELIKIVPLNIRKQRLRDDMF